MSNPPKGGENPPPREFDIPGLRAALAGLQALPNPSEHERTVTVLAQRALKRLTAE